MILEPALVGFGAEGSDQAQAARGVGRDPDHPRPPLDLFVEPLEHVGRLEMLVVLARQAVEGQRFADVGFDPVGELGVARRPAREPRLEVLLRFFEIAPVVEPAQLLAAIVVGFARQIVEDIAEEVHVAALPHGFGQQLAHGALQARVIVGDDKLHAVEPPRLQPFHKRRPTRPRLPIRELHAQNLAAPFPVDPDRDQHRLRLDHPVEADLFVARIEDQIRIRLVEPALRKAPQQPVQALVDPADGAGREGVPAQLLGHRLHLARRYPLDIHFGQRAHQRFLRALIPVEQFRREAALPVARHRSSSFPIRVTKPRL